MCIRLVEYAKERRNTVEKMWNRRIRTWFRSIDLSAKDWQGQPMKNDFTIKRMPRAWDVELGTETGTLFSHVSADFAQFATGVAGSSPYLADLLQKERIWIEAALSAPHDAFEQVLAEIDCLAPDQVKPKLRQAKRRVALLTALCDLAGCWDLTEVTTAITRFAQKTVDVAIKTEVAALIRRNKLPGMGPQDVESAAGLSVLAMGKMGAYELNYSSDVDLICLIDESRYDRSDFLTARQGLVRATRNMCATLGERTAEGYVFRTDLRLRPDPSVTPVAVAMEAAERYYESLGRTWERAAYIKARACAGDTGAGERFLNTLTPFVWRKHLDFAAIEDAHNMRLRIRENKGTGGPVSVPGHDMKLGRGGIREIEFFTQTRQLIAGGRDPSLRLRGTVEGLAALAARDWVPEDVAQRLSTHYRAHREVEHRIQMVHDAQTHRMPQSEEGIGRVAGLMGMAPEALLREIAERLDEVHILTEGFFAPQGKAAKPPRPELPETLDRDVIARWRTYPALRSDRGARIFDRLKPELFARLSRTANPSEALLALDGFLKGLPAGVQLFSLFEANPQLIDLLVDVVGTSPALAEYLSRNASVFDAVLDGGFFAPWPGKVWLKKDLATILSAEDDYESALDTARRWCKEWHFRTGVHHLRGLIDATQAGVQYGDLAEAVIAALTPVVIAQFETKHGAMPGRGCAVVAMGSLGAGRINAQSDLDLIVIYDPQDAETSDGKRPLAVRPYYARLTQALVTALTAPMSQGRLYEVDMRLRPSGSQGPVATSLASFTHYQENEAWTWEHLALTRARVIAGQADLAEDIEAFRCQILARGHNLGVVLRDVSDMRARLAAAKFPTGPWDAKTGAGRMLDIELFAQAGALAAGRPARSVHDGLEAAVASGWVAPEKGRELADAYELMWSVQMAARLIAGKGPDALSKGEGGQQFVLRSTGYSELERLLSQLEVQYQACGATIDAAIAAYGVPQEPDN